MNKRKFFTPEENAEIKSAIKAKKMTLDDINLLIKSDLQDIYNTLLSSLYSRKISNSLIYIDDDSIIYKHVVDDILECYNIPFWKFHILIEEKYVTLNGRGYTFEKPAIKLTNTEYERLLYLTYDIGI